MRTLLIITLLLCHTLYSSVYSQTTYCNNRYPLLQKPLIELPLGSIKPQGWLKEMLLRQKNGATGQMDKLYPLVMGERNGWLGGDGDQWERGPYWIDGLLPLAYLLDDQVLKDKVQPWIEWTLNSQREDGFFGPEKDYPAEPGLQRDNSQDWWPRMVMLKVLQQYYSATGDQRVIPFMSRYFRYQLATLPQKPLGHWSFWAEYRVCDNLQAVYWLYNHTGEPFLLELADLLHRQGYNFTDRAQDGTFRRLASIHCVNLAQGLKEPVIYYQQHPEPRYIEAVKTILKDIRQYHGQPQGMYGGDEALHGSNPTQGSELCSVVELMYSLEKMTEITADIQFADHLERIAYNALPAQISDDFMTKQYYQQPNQVCVTRYPRNFDQDHDGTDILFGILTGYPCCFSNMHQGWPKFTQSLWYATPDNGLAAWQYAPSKVTALVAEGYQATFNEETCYPMESCIRFRLEELHVPKGKKGSQVDFALHLRIPQWCKQATTCINGREKQMWRGGQTAVIRRTWQVGDRVELYLPMEIRTSIWHENSVSIERGPLVYALKLKEQVCIKDGNNGGFGSYREVTTGDAWNYGLVGDFLPELNRNAEVHIDSIKAASPFPWNTENAPVEILVTARRIPTWQLYNESAGPQPFSFCNKAQGNEEKITLIPYGCTQLRISEFPVVGRSR